MAQNMRNPFENQVKTDWTKKVEKKLDPIQKETKPKERVAKSFKIYKGEIARSFDKRVNKMQVHFDDKDYQKNYVDSGKYIMFLMAFAEKYRLYELYSEVSENGKFDIGDKELKEFIKKLN